MRDLESGREFDIAAKQIINAAGVWIDELHRNVPEGLDAMADPSTQTAIVVPAEAKPIVR